MRLWQLKSIIEIGYIKNNMKSKARNRIEYGKKGSQRTR